MSFANQEQVTGLVVTLLKGQQHRQGIFDRDQPAHDGNGKVPLGAGSLIDSEDAIDPG
jgi:hypothetical protein